MSGSQAGLTASDFQILFNSHVISMGPIGAIAPIGLIDDFDNQTKGTAMNRYLRAFSALLICTIIPVAEAKRAPNLEFKNLAGQTQRISDLRGSITVVNFWATWCGPCIEELPLLSRLSQEYSPKKVRFVAISADESPDSTKTRARVDLFLSHQKLTMDIWLGADLDMLDRLNLGNELPATVILDEQGEVVSRVMGQAHQEDISAPLDWLLSDRTGPAPQAVVKRY
jgi:thiol-disulfide isomerase/thioredoxin